MNNALISVYQKLFKKYKAQYWWPGNSRLEIIIGAILTQNTNWGNVEKAINNLKKEKLLSFDKLYQLNIENLAGLIRPSGYFNIKAKRLKNFLYYLKEKYNGNINRMFSRDLNDLRKELLNVSGIGPETADSILLYAGNYPIFVVDAYTKRIFLRHKFIEDDASYEEIQKLFMDNLRKNTKLFNEYHALIVKLGKEVCLKTKPQCEICPLKNYKFQFSNHKQIAN
ncbi:MAG: endonuclease III domain-containing protein [Candidatus Omnitrophota bacterium]